MLVRALRVSLVLFGVLLCGLTATSFGQSTGGVVNTPYGPLSVFPADNPWNQDISQLPVHSNSANFLQSIGLTKTLHPDFGTVFDGAPNGIPYVVVRGTQTKVPVSFDYADESDPGPYPIPPNAPIEGGPQSDGDRHVLVLDYDNKKLYELFAAYPNGAGWTAGSGAIFDLTSNAVRPAGWTSADAAGLPIFPGLARYDEVVGQGEIRHALRFTVSRTQMKYIYPARHYASSSTDPNRPPMGLRFRLKANYDISGFPPQATVILKALKKYGMIVADNGSDMFISGAPDPNWDDDDLHALGRVPTSAFEVVDTENAPPPPPPPTGPSLAWAFSLPGGNIYRVAPTADGGACVAGDFSGTVDFDPGAGVRNLTATGSYDAFLAKYGAQGNLVWIKQVSSTAMARNAGLAIGSSGLVHVYGTYVGTATLGAGESKAMSIRSGSFGTGPGKAKNAYIAQFDGSTGALQWGLNLTGSANLSEWGDVAVDSTGRVVIESVSEASGTIRFVAASGTSTNQQSLPASTTFVAQLSSTGAVSWIFQLPNATAALVHRGLAIGPQDSISVAGGLSGTTDFNPATGGKAVLNLTKPANVLSATFLARYTSAGAVSWAVMDQGPPNSQAQDSGSMLAVASSGSSLLTSSGTMYKGSSSGSLAQLNSTGTWGWMKPLSPNGMVVALDSTDNVYVTAGDQVVTRYTSAGATSWTTTVKWNALDMVLNPAKELFFVGKFNSAMNVSPGTTQQMLNPAGAGFVPFVVKWKQP